MYKKILLALILFIVCFAVFPYGFQKVGTKPPEVVTSITLLNNQPAGGYDILIGTKNFGVFRSFYNSYTFSNWQQTALNEFMLSSEDSTQPPATITTMNKAGSNIVAGTSNGKIFYSSDQLGGFQNWYEAQIFPSTEGLPIAKIVLDEVTGFLYALIVDKGLYLSTDLGQNFYSLIPSIGNGNFGDLDLIRINGTLNLLVCTRELLNESGKIYYIDEDLNVIDITPTGYYSFGTVKFVNDGANLNFFAGDLLGAGCIYSSDMGNSWTSISNICEPVRAIHYSQNTNSIFIGTDYGLYQYVNGNAHEVYPRDVVINSIISDPFNPDNLLLATSSGVKKNIYGLSYPQNIQANDLAKFDIGIIKKSPNYESDQVIFAVSKKYGIFISFDGGSTFGLYMEPIQREIVSDPKDEIVGFGISPDFSYTTGVCGDSSSTIYIATKGNGVYKSSYGGSGWFPINNGLNIGNLCAFEETPNPYPYILFSAISGNPTIYRFYAPEERWFATSLPNGLPNENVLVISFPPGFGSGNPPNTTMYVGTTRGLYYSNDGGTTFNFDSTLPSLPSGNDVTAIAFHPSYNFPTNQTMYVVRGGALFKRVFQDSQWQWIRIGQNSFPQDQYFIKKLAVSPLLDGQYVITASFNHPINPTDNGIYISYDEGQSFTRIENSPDPFPIELEIFKININGNNILRLFAGFRKERLWYIPNLLDQNLSFIPSTGWESSPLCVNTTLVSSYGTLTSCKLVSTPTDVFLGTCNGVFWSNDGGETFRPINKGLFSTLSNSPCRPLNILSLHMETLSYITPDGTVYRPILIAGSNEGVFYRIPTQVIIDGQTFWDWYSGTWVKANGIGNLPVYKFSPEKGLNKVIAATNDGVYVSYASNGLIGHNWEKISLSEDFRAVCFGQSVPFKSNAIHTPEAPTGGTIWGTIWGSGVRKGTEQQNYRGESIIWEFRNGSNAGTIEELYNWTVIQLKDGTLLTGGNSKGIFRSDDEGLYLWYPANSGIENTTLKVREIIEVSNGDVLCAVEGSGSNYDGGIFISADKGLHWACLSPQFDPEEQKLSDIIYSEDEPPVYYAGTYNNGTYAGTVTPQPPPEITSISTTSGPSTGGTTVTISGSKFLCSCPEYYDCEHFGISQAVASFGGIDAETISCSEDELVVVTPAHLAGTVSVSVRNPDTRYATLSNAFTYTGESSATIYLSLDSAKRIVVTTSGSETPTKVFRATNPQFTGYIKVDNLENGSFVYQDSSNTNSYLYFYKVE